MNWERHIAGNLRRGGVTPPYELPINRHTYKPKTAALSPGGGLLYSMLTG